LKATPPDFESSSVAVRKVSALSLNADAKNPIVRQLLDFDASARGVASGEEGFVDNLFREVSALRLGQKQWLCNDTKDVGIGADTACPFELEPSVTERLYKMSLKVVGKNT
jgi:hypothetical protein